MPAPRLPRSAFALRFAKRCVGAPLLAVCAYLLAALVGCALTVNRDAAAPVQGTPVRLRSNGVHVDLVLPVRTARHDWERAFERADSPGAPPTATHIAVGWGSREFFTRVREWGDLAPAPALRAVSFDRSVLHVEYLDPPADGPCVRTLVVTDAQYDRLVQHVLDSVERDGEGAARPLGGLGYGPADAFYEGRGRYTLVTTCNEWVNVALKDAGVRTVLWAPFAQALVPGCGP